MPRMKKAPAELLPETAWPWLTIRLSAFWSLPALIILSGAMLTVCANWFSALFHAYQAEQFPTRMRATGVGFTYSWSRLSAVFSTLIIGALLAHGVFAVFLFMAADATMACI